MFGKIQDIYAAFLYHLSKVYIKVDGHKNSTHKYIRFRQKSKLKRTHPQLLFSSAASSTQPSFSKYINSDCDILNLETDWPGSTGESGQRGVYGIFVGFALHHAQDQDADMAYGLMYFLILHETDDEMTTAMECRRTG